jgi:hypothetical protein
MHSILFTAEKSVGTVHDKFGDEVAVRKTRFPANAGSGAKPRRSAASNRIFFMLLVLNISTCYSQYPQAILTSYREGVSLSHKWLRPDSAAR